MFLKTEKNKKDDFKRGVILLELVVALGIFLAVMTIGMGAVLSIYGLNKKSQSLKLVMTNLNFAVESMAREIVVGTDYRCPYEGGFDPLNCTSGDISITFCSSEGKQIFYKFDNDNGAIQRYIEIGDIPDESTCGEGSPSDNDFQNITAPEVEIQNMKFFVDGASLNGDECLEQPRVVILVEGEAGIREEEKSEFSIQTTASQRAPKIDESCVYN